MACSLQTVAVTQRLSVDLLQPHPYVRTTRTRRNGVSQSGLP